MGGSGPTFCISSLAANAAIFEFMPKYLILILAAILLSVVPTLSQAPPPPPAPLAPTKEVGKAKSFYRQKTDTTLVELSTYIEGSVMDIYEKKKEVVVLTLQSSIVGRKLSKPDFFSLALTSYSAKPGKYAANPAIKIIVDGDELIAEMGLDRYAATPFLRSSSESYGIQRIRYKDFTRMTKGSRVTIQIGDTKITLSDEDMQALKDLKKLIED